MLCILPLSFHHRLSCGRLSSALLIPEMSKLMAACLTSLHHPLVLSPLHHTTTPHYTHTTPHYTQLHPTTPNNTHTTPTLHLHNARVWTTLQGSSTEEYFIIPESSHSTQCTLPLFVRHPPTPSFCPAFSSTDSYKLYLHMEVTALVISPTTTTPPFRNNLPLANAHSHSPAAP